MSVPILCFSCHTHLMNTDVARLDWPLTGEMFDCIFPGWSLRPGPLNLEIFCPVCMQFPFHHNPYIAGGNAVGKNLCVKGADGKAVVMTIKDILLSSHPLVIPAGALKGPPNILPSQQWTTAPPLDPKPRYQKAKGPCPHCGNRPNASGSIRHKKSCILLFPPRGGSKVQEVSTPPPGAKPPITPPCPMCGGRPDAEREIVHGEGCPVKAREEAVKARVKVGGPLGDGSVTTEEAAEAVAERGHKAFGKSTEGLRPGEGFVPKASQR